MRASDHLLEVGERPPLEPEEELELARRVAAGEAARRRLETGEVPAAERAELEETVRRGQEAKAALVAGTLRLVVAMAERYRWSGVPLADLFQEGVLGLLRAAERFDWTRGTPFSAYAAWWVRHAIARAVREARVGVHLPDRQWKLLRRLGRARLADPSADAAELARAAGVDPEEAERLLPLLGTPVSLEAPVGADHEAALGELLADRRAEEALEEVLVEAEVERLLHVAERVLSPRERRVLEARYGLGGRDPRTLREVGAELGLTPQRVAQIEGRALEKLRAALGAEEAPGAPSGDAPGSSWGAPRRGSGGAPEG
jgi:RNA polymerase sigma factor (sigma-70 family)